jgi:hypothetical protein
MRAGLVAVGEFHHVEGITELGRYPGIADTGKLNEAFSTVAEITTTRGEQLTARIGAINNGDVTVEGMDKSIWRHPNRRGR